MPKSSKLICILSGLALVVSVSLMITTLWRTYGCAGQFNVAPVTGPCSAQGLHTAQHRVRLGIWLMPLAFMGFAGATVIVVKHNRNQKTGGKRGN